MLADIFKKPTPIITMIQALQDLGKLDLVARIEHQWALDHPYLTELFSDLEIVIEEDKDIPF